MFSEVAFSSILLIFFELVTFCMTGNPMEGHIILDRDVGQFARDLKCPRFVLSEPPGRPK
jgi:hypothetical protein